MLVREVGGLLSPPQDVRRHADDPGQDKKRSGHVERSVVTARRVVERPGLWTKENSINFEIPKSILRYFS